jgi:hypothetical protein
MYFGEEKMKTQKDERMVKLGFFFLKKCPCLGIYQKISTFTFGAWSFHGPTSWSMV